MTDETAIRQLVSLINDRESLCTGDKEYDEVFLDDIEALKIGLGAVAERAEKRFISECCPYCNERATVEWSLSKDGHSWFCPHCGNKIMLCSECPAKGDESRCDGDEYDGEYGERICFWDDYFERT